MTTPAQTRSARSRSATPSLNIALIAVFAALIAVFAIVPGFMIGPVPFVLTIVIVLASPLIVGPLQGVLAAVQVIITSCLGIFSIAAALEGYIVAHAPWWQRILLAAGGLCLIDPEFMTDVVGVAVIVVVIVLQIVLRKHSKPAAA